MTLNSIRHLLNYTVLRLFLLGLITSVSILSLPPHLATQSQISPRLEAKLAYANEVVSYRSPTCGCCKEWVKHLQNNGFRVQDNVVENMEELKEENAVPPEMTSCHTAIIDGYVIEGHVPASDIQKLLREKSPVIGIAAPGMPIGSPGMEVNDIKEPYTVFTFDAQGQFKPFSEHNS